ncbi:MAG TPA: ABC transporter ATP-binding protein [Holophagaceae bacterium]|nr:ABC transporter ATP-binding protein [Holophagaceae bacterium]
MSVLLEAKDLRCVFKGPTEAVRSLDLTLSPGDLVGLIGPDGAGKTTTFRMIVGLQKPSGGRLDLNVGPEQIGYVPQKFSLAPDLTVEENMRLQAGVYGMADPEPRMRRLLESVELDRFRSRLSGALSGGMKQKLALCVALLPEPRLLLLDEPTTGVDPVSRREFWELLHGVHDEGVAILFSSPYMDEAEYAHRMLLMHEGHILDQGDLTAFRAKIPGVTVKIVTSARRKVQLALWEMKPLDLFGEGEIIRVRFPAQPTEPLLARVLAIPDVERAEVSEATLEDFFLHALMEAETGPEAKAEAAHG